MTNRIDLVNVTNEMQYYELSHREVCRAIGVCQCKNGAPMTIYIPPKSALTNRPGEFALSPRIAEDIEKGKLKIKKRKERTTSMVGAPAVAPSSTSASPRSSRRRERDQA